MHNAVKLLTGLAASVVLARGATQHQGQDLLSELGHAAQTAMAAHDVADGSVRFRGEDGRTDRVARLSGSADAATRAAIIADLERHPGIAGAIWVER